MLDDIDPLKLAYRSSFKNVLHLTSEDFEILVNKLGPKVSKKDTNCRHAIPVNERIAVILRFLATGDCYETLSTVFKMSKQLICKIIPGVCRAIFELKDYVQVNKYIFLFQVQ
jgi:hypothetical protein